MKVMETTSDDKQFIYIYIYINAVRLHQTGLAHVLSYQTITDTKTIGLQAKISVVSEAIELYSSRQECISEYYRICLLGIARFGFG
jgi:hypothetical protein